MANVASFPQVVSNGVLVRACVKEVNTPFVGCTVARSLSEPSPLNWGVGVSPFDLLPLQILLALK